MAPVLRSLCLAATLLSTAMAYGSISTTTSSSSSLSTISSASKTLTMPLYELGSNNTGSTALPTPTVQPKYIALGIGFQNYTCANTTASASSGATPTPTIAYVQTKPSTGALANLYDITKNLNQCNLDFIPAEALGSFETCLAKTQCNPAVSDCQWCHEFAINYIRSRGIAPAPKIGLHFFPTINNTQTPSFNVFAYGNFLSGKKVGDVKAPANSSTGANGIGAVDWLYLTPNAFNLTKGLTAVYRVETAGGAAPKTCSKIGQNISLPYTAEYWFYG